MAYSQICTRKGSLIIVRYFKYDEKASELHVVDAATITRVKFNRMMEVWTIYSRVGKEEIETPYDMFSSLDEVFQAEKEEPAWIKMKLKSSFEHLAARIHEALAFNPSSNGHYVGRGDFF